MNTLDFVTQNSRALILLSLQFYLVLVSAACRQEKAQHLKSKKADIRLRCCALLATFFFIVHYTSLMAVISHPIDICSRRCHIKSTPPSYCRCPRFSRLSNRGSVVLQNGGVTALVAQVGWVATQPTRRSSFPAHTLAALGSQRILVPCGGCKGLVQSAGE